MGTSDISTVRWFARTDLHTSPHLSKRETILNCLRDGVALLDSSAAVTFSNIALDRMLRAGCGLRMRSGHLFAECPRANAELRAAVNDCLSERRHFGAPSAVSIWDVGRTYPIVVSVLPIGRDNADVPGSRPTAAMLLAVDTMPSVGLDDRFLRDAFQLTDAEALVARRLVGGDTLAGIAATKGISLHTARSQLKSIMLKLGISRQSELVALLSRCDNVLRTSRPQREGPPAISGGITAGAAARP